MRNENELNNLAGSFSSRSLPHSFDMSGGALSLPSSSSGVVARLLVASCAVVVLPCLACFVSLVRAFLRCLRRVCLLSVPASFRPVVVSFGSPFVRQVGRGDGGLRLGRCVMLLAVAEL